MPYERHATNPVSSSRKLKLGTFQTNLDSGCVMSDSRRPAAISWPNTRALARLADEMEFEAIVPVARWRGFGGGTNRRVPGFETYTWAAGIAASTTTSRHRLDLCMCPVNHPLMAAKQCAAIDHISAGRFILNVVCGWNGPEMEMFDPAHAPRRPLRPSRGMARIVAAGARRTSSTTTAASTGSKKATSPRNLCSGPTRRS